MEKKDWKYWLNHFESYISCGCFLAITVLLFVQVVSRYVFGRSYTWTEELATILFVAMIYCAMSAAVTDRKHIRIEALLEAVPFKVKKCMLIISELIFFFFCIYIQPAMFMMIRDLGSSVTPLLRIPKAPVYLLMPLLLLLTGVRIIQNIIRWWKEKEEKLGATTPAIDLDAIEREYLAEKARMEAEQAAAVGKEGME